MNKVYFTSDLHFCHNKEFLYGPRGFSSVEEMNEAIIRNFNTVMDWTDKLYILGDCFLNDNYEGMKLMTHLPGEKYIIYGNHDTDTRQVLMGEAGFHCLGYAHQQKINGYRFYMSHYPTLTSNYDDNIKPLKRRTINLCGHSHTQNRFQDFGKGLIYHIELDAHNMMPVCIDDIIIDIEKYLKALNDSSQYID